MHMVTCPCFAAGVPSSLMLTGQVESDRCIFEQDEVRAGVWAGKSRGRSQHTFFQKLVQGVHACKLEIQLAALFLEDRGDVASHRVMDSPGSRAHTIISSDLRMEQFA